MSPAFAILLGALNERQLPGSVTTFVSIVDSSSLTNCFFTTFIFFFLEHQQQFSLLPLKVVTLIPKSLISFPNVGHLVQLDFVSFS